MVSSSLIDDAVQKIDGCHLCELEGVPRLRVPVGAKFHPPVPPPRPTRLLFVAVAPPWGGSSGMSLERIDFEVDC